MSGSFWLGEDPAAVEQATPTSTFTWATITGTAPLRIRLDAMAEELPITPASLVAPANLAAGKRAWVQIYGKRAVIIGLANGGVAV